MFLQFDLKLTGDKKEELKQEIILLLESTKLAKWITYYMV